MGRRNSPIARHKRELPFELLVVADLLHLEATGNGSVPYKHDGVGQPTASNHGLAIALCL
jgi:hypothetical protein